MVASSRFLEVVIIILNSSKLMHPSTLVCGIHSWGWSVKKRKDYWRWGSQSTQQRLYDFARMALINIFAHPYAAVRCSFFPFNSLIPFPVLILTPIHSRCATCTVEMTTLINGSTLKLATTLELVLPSSSSQSHLSFSLVNCSCCCCCFCRCAFV